MTWITIKRHVCYFSEPQKRSKTENTPKESLQPKSKKRKSGNYREAARNKEKEPDI